MLRTVVNLIGFDIKYPHKIDDGAGLWGWNPTTGNGSGVPHDS